MYIWVGINLDDQLLDVSDFSKQVYDSVGFQGEWFTLPMHVSLKISFELNSPLAEDAIGRITQLLLSVKPFEIKVSGIEREGGIIWIRMINNATLTQLHDDLNELLLTEYSVPLHEYDLDYKFHTTLFISDDSSKLDKAYCALQQMSAPNVLKANSFLIGTSPNGANGTYKVRVQISNE